MPIDPKSLTINSKALLKMSVQEQPEPPRRSLGQELMNSLTPTQYAAMFPGHYKRGQGTKVASLGHMAVPPPEGSNIGGMASSGPSQQRQQGGGGRTPNIASLRNTEEPKPKAWHERLAKFDDPASTDAPSYAKDRQRFSNEIKDDNTIKKLYNLAYTEVGSDPKEQQKWAETVFNRAQFSGKTISEIINDKVYYPKHTTNQVSAEKLENFRNSVVSPVMAGSNLTKSATDNASNDYRINPQTGRDNQVANNRIAKGATGEWSKGALDRGEYHYYGGERAGKYRTAHGVLAEQNQKRIEEAARLAAAEKEKQGPKVAVPPLPEGMNESVMKHFNGLPDEAAKERFRKQVHRAIESGEFTVDSLNKEAEARAVAATTEGSNVQQRQQDVAKIRRLPIKADLESILDYAGERSGVQFEVTSGGQHRGRGPTTGSMRHDVNQNTIGAADGRLFVMEDGKKRYLSIYNKDDLEKINKFTEHFSAKAPGAGVGTDYMGKTKKDRGELFHFGGPNRPGEEARNYDGRRYIGAGFEAGRKRYGSQEIVDDYANFVAKRQEQREARALAQQQKAQQVASTGKPAPTPEPVSPATPAAAAPTKPQPFFQGHPGRAQSPSPATPTVTPTNQAASATAPPSPATAPPSPAAAAPVPAAPPSPAAAAEPKKEEPPVPKMKTGGEAQAQSEHLAVVNTLTGKPQLMFNPSEKFEVDKGRIKVTPEHRNEPDSIEPKPKPEPRQQNQEQPVPQQIPQQAQAPAMERTNIYEHTHIPQGYHSPSYKRAMDRAVGFREEGNHYNDFISTQKRA